jgi:hypothetical protein
MPRNLVMISKEPRDILIESLIEERWPGAVWEIRGVQWNHDDRREVVIVIVRPVQDYIEISFSVELDNRTPVR